MDGYDGLAPAPRSARLFDLPDEVLVHAVGFLDEARDVAAWTMASARTAAIGSGATLWARLYARDHDRLWARHCKSVADAIDMALVCGGHSWRSLLESRGKTQVTQWAQEQLAHILRHDRWFGCAWSRLIDLAGGHPRTTYRLVACARASIEPVHREPAGVPAGGDVVFMGTRINIGGGIFGPRMTIRRGGFDADGLLRGPGLYWSTDCESVTVPQTCVATPTGRRSVRSAVGIWARGALVTQAEVLVQTDDKSLAYIGPWGPNGPEGCATVRHCDGTLVCRGQWKHGALHGPVSWRAAHSLSLVAHAVYGGASERPPDTVSWFADGRLRFRNTTRPGRSSKSDARLCARYSRSGVTITGKSPDVYVHAWPNGDLVAGRIVPARDRALSVGLFRFSPRSPEAAVAGRVIDGTSLGLALGVDADTGHVRIQWPDESGPALDVLRDYEAAGHAGWCTAVCDARDPSWASMMACHPPTDQMVTRATIGTHPAIPASFCAADADMALCENDFRDLVDLAPGGRTGTDDDDDENDSSTGPRACDVALVDLLTKRGVPEVPVCGGRARDAVCLWDDLGQRLSTHLCHSWESLDLSRIHLQRVVVAGVVLDGVDFRGARLDRCAFYRCWFAACRWESALIADSHFVACAFSADRQVWCEDRRAGDDKWCVDQTGALDALRHFGAVVVTTASHTDRDPHAPF